MQPKLAASIGVIPKCSKASGNSSGSTPKPGGVDQHRRAAVERGQVPASDVGVEGAGKALPPGPATRRSGARPAGLGWMAPARASSTPSIPASTTRRNASMTTSWRLLWPPAKNRPTDRIVRRSFHARPPVGIRPNGGGSDHPDAGGRQAVVPYEPVDVAPHEFRVDPDFVEFTQPRPPFGDLLIGHPEGKLQLVHAVVAEGMRRREDGSCPRPPRNDSSPARSPPKGPVSRRRGRSRTCPRSGGAGSCCSGAASRSPRVAVPNRVEKCDASSNRTRSPPPGVSGYGE